MFDTSPVKSTLNLSSHSSEQILILIYRLPMFLVSYSSHPNSLRSAVCYVTNGSKKFFLLPVLVYTAFWDNRFLFLRVDFTFAKAIFFFFCCEITGVFKLWNCLLLSPCWSNLNCGFSILKYRVRSTLYPLPYFMLVTVLKSPQIVKHFRDIKKVN